METTLTLPQIDAIDTALLIEDNDDVAYLIRFLLMREGYFVHTVSNGRDAEDYIAKMSPTDIVIMDLMLPYVNGFELITQVRESLLWRNVPIIVLSGKVNEQDIVRAFDLGANDYVTKPYKPQELAARIKRLTPRKLGE
jgi:two-component system, OmpR family, alkaline phosphatase synthesis response regulator PhoP